MSVETDRVGERTSLLHSNGNGAPISDGNPSSRIAQRDPDALSTARVCLILGSIWIGVVFTAVDSTVVATLIVPMTNDFSSLKTLSWLGSSYLIAATATIPISGRLTDVYGRHAGAVLSSIVFSIGTMICGLATTEWMLLLGRIVSGLGSGPLRVISSFVSSDILPTQKRGLAQGINLVFMGAGTAAGGSLGGWIDGYLGWRWAFLVQMPFLILGTVLTFLFVKTPLKTTSVPALRRIDWVGCVSLVTSLTLLLVGVNAGGNLVPWTDTLVLATLVLAVLLFGVFVYEEGWRASEPILPLDMFKQRTVTAACLYYFFAHFASFSIMFYVPLYTQLRGNSPAQAGLRFIPLAAGNAIGALITGIVIRRTGRYQSAKYASIAFLLASAGAFASLSFRTPPWCTFLFVSMQGIGFGIQLVVPFIALLSTVDHADQAVATAALITVAAVGSVFGISISAAVFHNVLGTHLRRSLGSSKQAEDVIEQVRRAFGAIPNIDKIIRPQVEAAFMAGVQHVFMLTLAVTILAAFSALAIKQNKLHMTVSRED